MTELLTNLKTTYLEIENRLTKRLSSRQESQELLITIGGIVIVLAVVLVVSIAKPLTEQLSQTLFIEHFGEFSYRADARAGIYDHNFAETGEPFFWDLSEELHAEFAYRANGFQPGKFQGTYKFSAYLMDEHGWQRTLKVGEETPFTTFPLTLSLDMRLDDIANILNTYQRQTGISRNNYLLVLKPQIDIEGSAGGVQASSEFSPELTFYITTSEFYLVSDDEVTLKPELIESITTSVEQGGTLNLFSFAIPIQAIRWTSLVLLLVALGFFAIFISFHTRMLHLEDPTGLGYQFGEWIVDVSKMPDEKDMILVSEFEQLARLAEVYDLVILHNQIKSIHYYYIKADEGYFYHVVGEK